MAFTPPQPEAARHAVIANELRWHDEEAHRREGLDHFLYDPPAFDDVVAAQLAFLALQPGDLLLELGSGPGKETLRFSRMQQKVVTVDLSYGQLSAARGMLRARNPDAEVFHVQANAEELPFAAGAFRVIYGKAVVHHLDLELAAREINRLLRPDGRASFAEPLADHPLILLGRRLTPKLRTQDEHPLRVEELETLGGEFRCSQSTYTYLLAPLAYFARLLPGAEPIFRNLYRLLNRVDQLLLSRLGGLRQFAWYGILHVTR